MANEEWREMQKELAKYKMNIHTANLLLANYESINDIVRKGACNLFTLRGCGKKTFAEVVDFLYKRGYIKEKWTEKKISEDFTDKERQLLFERVREGLTVQELSKRHGLTKQRVSRLLQTANAKAARLYVLSEDGTNGN